MAMAFHEEATAASSSSSSSLSFIGSSFRNESSDHFSRKKRSLQSYDTTRHTHRHEHDERPWKVHHTDRGRTMQMSNEHSGQKNINHTSSMERNKEQSSYHHQKHQNNHDKAPTHDYPTAAYYTPPPPPPAPAPAPAPPGQRRQYYYQYSHQHHQNQYHHQYQHRNQYQHQYQYHNQYQYQNHKSHQQYEQTQQHYKEPPVPTYDDENEHATDSTKATPSDRLYNSDALYNEVVPPPPQRTRAQQQDDANGEKAAANQRQPIAVLIRGLPLHVTGKQLMLELLRDEGDISGIILHKDVEGNNVGTAEVTFENKLEAQRMVIRHNQKPYAGSILRISLLESETIQQTSALVRTHAKHDTSMGIRDSHAFTRAPDAIESTSSSLVTSHGAAMRTASGDSMPASLSTTEMHSVPVVPTTSTKRARIPIMAKRSTASFDPALNLPIASSQLRNTDFLSINPNQHGNGLTTQNREHINSVATSHQETSRATLHVVTKSGERFQTSKAKTNAIVEADHSPVVARTSTVVVTSSANGKAAISLKRKHNNFQPHVVLPQRR